MNVFVIGAPGYIGRSVTTKLLESGHHVIALARSNESAAHLPVGDIEVIRGEIADLDHIRRGLEQADAVIYLAIHGGQGQSPDDSAAISLIIKTLAGTNKPFIMTGSVGVYTGIPGTAFDEDTPLDETAPPMKWRVQLERTVLDAATGGIRSIVIRPSFVYGRGSASPILLAPLAHARKSGNAVYIGEGNNVVPVIHVDDLATLYVVALDHAPSGAIFNGVGSTISSKDVAKGISYAAGLNGEIVSLPLPEAITTLGGLAQALAENLVLSGLRTAQVLGWFPTGPSLLYELTHGSLSQPAA